MSLSPIQGDPPVSDGPHDTTGFSLPSPYPELAHEKCPKCGNPMRQMHCLVMGYAVTTNICDNPACR